LSSLARLGLGTVQFGLDYGISNRDGRPSEAEVAAILAHAVDAGVGYLDTAASYADAEVLIGRHLPAHHDLRIVTKLPPLKADSARGNRVELTMRAMETSLERLRLTKVHAVLVHSVGDLAEPGWETLVEALRLIKQKALATRVGVSIYDEGDLDLVQSRFEPELVQFPLNVLDRRLVFTGRLAALKGAGVELHARSVFLQGLLLMPAKALPQFFAPLRAALEKLQARWAAAEVPPLAACLHYVLGQSQVDAAIVGVNRVHEFNEIAAALSAPPICPDLFEPVEAIDPAFVDPRRWPKAAQ